MKSKALFTIGFATAVALGVRAADENAVLIQELSANQAPSQQVQNIQPSQTLAAPNQQLVAPAPVQAAPAQAPIYIIEKQPTTYIEDAPLKESKADQLRKAREEVERQTEERIVEKLEADRVRAEQDRAQKVLEAFENKVEQPPVAPAPVAPQAVVEAPVAPVTVAPPPTVIEVKTEVPMKPEEEKVKDRTIISADAGFVSYPSAENVSSGFSGGASIGRSFGKQLLMDVSFLYSNLDVESVNFTPFFGVPYITEVEQYNIGANLRYRLLEDTIFSPVVGGGISYTLREYQWDLVPYQPVMQDPPSSWAVDLGLLIGFDVRLSPKFRVGVDYRYFMNVAYDLESRYERSMIFSGPLAQKELEEFSYQVFTVKGMLLF